MKKTLTDVFFDKKDPVAKRVMDIALKYSFQCKIYKHEISGKTTENATQALKIEPSKILKSLYLIDSKKEDGEGFAVIIRGIDKLDTKALSKLISKKTGYNPKLKFANEEKICEKTGFKLGGIPVLAFVEKNITTYVDKKVLLETFVVGSGGSEFHGMEFEPSELLNKLKYNIAEITKKAENHEKDFDKKEEPFIKKTF